MEQQKTPFDRGQLLKMLFLGAVMMIWFPLSQRLFPEMFGQKPAVDALAEVEGGADQPLAEDDKSPAAVTTPGPVVATPAEVKPVPGVGPSPVVPVVAPAAQAAADVLAEAPPTQHTLGAIERGKGFFMEVKLTSKGAAVEWAKLNDERYSTVEDRKVPLQVLGNRIKDADGTEPDSFQTAIEAIDAQIQSQSKSTRTVHWELLPGATSETATFRLRAPDGSVEVRKTYTLHKGDEKDRDEDEVGYLLDLDIEIQNLKDVELKQSYKLQGPVGLPLENVANTRNFVELKAETHDDPLNSTDVTAITRTASEILGQFDKAVAKKDPNLVDNWRDPLHFVGVDVQFFMALIKPKTDQLIDTNKDGRPDPYFATVRPMILTRDKDKPQRSDISVMLTSTPLVIPPKGTVKHSFEIFIGPKRISLARPLGESPRSILGGWRSSRRRCCGFCNSSAIRATCRTGWPSSC